MTRRISDRENKYDDILYKALNLRPGEYLKVPTEEDPSRAFNAIRYYIKNGTSSVAIQACIAKLQVGILESDEGIALYYESRTPRTLEEIINSRKQEENPEVLVKTENLVSIR